MIDQTCTTAWNAFRALFNFGNLEYLTALTRRNEAMRGAGEECLLTNSIDDARALTIAWLFSCKSAPTSSTFAFKDEPIMSGLSAELFIPDLIENNNLRPSMLPYQFAEQGRQKMRASADISIGCLDTRSVRIDKHVYMCVHISTT